MEATYSPISFKQFLLEEDDPDLALVKRIKKECAPFLRASGGQFLIRGMNPENNALATRLDANNDNWDIDAWLIGVRNDREPLDSPRWLHDAMNESLKKLTGIPVRSACLFALGGDNVDNFGMPYAVFPVGEFNYVWSKMMPDPTYDLALTYSEDWAQPKGELAVLFEKTWQSFVKKAYPKAYAEFPTCEKFIEAASSGEVLGRSSHDTFTLAGGLWESFIQNVLDVHASKIWILNSGLRNLFTQKFKSHEVMIVCDKYYAVGYDEFTVLSEFGGR